IVLLSRATPASTPHTWWFVMISGAVAVCAMILPGISGAFILLLLGQYRYVMEAVAGVDIPIIFAFVAGAAAGLAAFSRFLSWLLNNYRRMTMAVLTGVLLGSLYKIWPWKRVVEWYTDSHGREHPLVETNVLPEDYAGDPRLLSALAAAAAGLILIMAVERAGKKIAGTRRAKAV
ncbi:MAG: DUF368 domain-containing protein, partial [Rikenellaceae bacterium]|nr:DUF368 domain-containing protein [Rikenellaceae bacterium]